MDKRLSDLLALQRATPPPRRSTVELPTWEQCAEAMGRSMATHLEKFIYNNEPVDVGNFGSHTAAEFREQLALLIEYERQPKP